MTPSLRTGFRQTLKTAAHSLGVVVAITLIGAVGGALIGTTCGMTYSALVYDGVPDGVFIYGAIGAAAGGVVGSGMLAASAFFKSFRRKLVTTTERVSRCLHCLALLGGCSIPVGNWISQGGIPLTDLARRPYGNFGPLTHSELLIYFGLLIVCGVAVGVVTGVVLGLIVGLLAVFSLAVVLLVRVSAGFLHSAPKGPKTAPVDLIGGASDPWLIRAAAVLMPPEAGRRWRDDFNEACYDYEDDQHAKLLRDFLVHAPAVVLWAWIAALQSCMPGGDSFRERRW